MTAFRNRTAIPLSSNQTMTVTEDSTAISYEWEYYYDYLDPVVVDESKLKYNKYSIVIILWITLAAFVGLLFLSLNLMSHSGTLTKRNRFKMKGSHRASSA